MRSLGAAVAAGAMLVASGCATVAPPPTGFAVMTGVGASPTDLGWLGKVTDRDIGLVAARKASAIEGSERFARVDEYSLVALTNTPEDQVPLNQCFRGAPSGRGSIPPNLTTSQYMQVCARRLVTSYGAGWAPLGLTATLTPSHALRWNVDASGGAVFFDHDVPYPGTLHFNFSAAAGTSLTFGTTWPRRSSMTLGYRLIHYSNAHLASSNPGIAIHTLLVSWAWPTVVR